MAETRIDYGDNHARVSQYLKDIKRLFDANDITFYLYFGTLLGAVRDKDFIAHDCDADIAIFGKDSDKTYALDKEFHKLGYRVVKNAGLKSSNRRVSYYISKEGSSMKVDIYTLFLFRKVRWFVRHINDKETKQRCEYAYPFNLKFFHHPLKIDFNGDKYLIPGPTNTSLLDYLWGKDKWKIPGHGMIGDRVLGVCFHEGELIDEENEWKEMR